MPGTAGYGITIEYPSSGTKYTSLNGTITIPVYATTDDQQYQSLISWTVVEYQEMWNFIGANGEGYLKNSVGFSHNLYFGLLTLKASYTTESNTYFDEVWIKSFFDKCRDEINPSSDPNWYYYWKQTTASTGTHMYDGSRNDVYGYYQKWSTYFYVCPLASGTNDFTGDEGIDSFAEVCLHEGTHVENWWDWWSGGYDSSNDWDSDYVPNNVEIADSELDPNDPYSNSLGVPDAEYFAYMAEYDWFVGSADNEDWADPGNYINSNDEGITCYETGGGNPKRREE